VVLARSTAADGGGGGGGGDVRQWLMKLQQSKDSRNAIKRLEEEARIQLLALGLLGRGWARMWGRGVTNEDMAAALPRRRPFRFNIENTDGETCGESTREIRNRNGEQ
jgi:hypothetical protein